MSERRRKPVRGRLGLEISLALVFKVVILAILWMLFFRPEPGLRKPDRADLFAPTVSKALQENNAHVR